MAAKIFGPINARKLLLYILIAQTHGNAVSQQSGEYLVLREIIEQSLAVEIRECYGGTGAIICGTEYTRKRFSRTFRPVCLFFNIQQI